MELRRKISDRELKLIILFITVILCFMAYQFGYIKYQQRTVRLRAENANMRIQVEDMRRKQTNKEEILRKTQENRERASRLTDEFPAYLKQEESTLLVRSLREYSGWKISHISYDEIAVFYSTAASEFAAAKAETDPGAAARAGQGGKGITGYKTTVTISYQTTYQGLKKGLAYLGEHKNRMSITNLTAAFDSTTGNLTGAISLVLYAVDGLGRKEENEVLPELKLGKDNIFGTFEINHKDGTSLSEE
jgi:hypothetical protein